MRFSNFIYGFLLLAIGAGIGWFLSREVLPQRSLQVQEPKPLVQQKVVAQGRILPESGLINIFAPPSQRIESILVSEGERVSVGAELATFMGQETLKMKTELVAAQGEDAKRELDQKILVAEGNVLAAANALDAATLQLQQVEEADSLVVAEKQIDAARQKLERMQQLAADPATKLYVAQTSLNDQRLELEQAESQFKLAQQKRYSALQGAKLNLEVAEKTHQQAQSVLESLRTLQQENRSLEISKSIAETSATNAKLFSPIEGTVLKINAKPGEVMLHTPLLQLGDLSNLVCVVEVVDRLVFDVKPGQKATLFSPALQKPVGGSVSRVGRIVGTGALSDPNPLAVTDRRTVEVIIAINPEDHEAAKQLINLQVTAEIEVEPAGASDHVPETDDL